MDVVRFVWAILRSGLIGRFLTIAATLGLAVTTQGAFAASESLEDALIEAYTTNPQLLAERAKLRATDEQVPIALSNWRPTVQLSSSAGYENNNTPYSTGIATITLPSDVREIGETAMADVTITQPVYRGDRTIAQTAQAEAQVESERANLIATEETVFLSVAEAYLDCVRDQALLNLTIENEQLLRDLMGGVEIQFRIGTLTQTDVYQIQGQYKAAAAARDQAEGALSASRDNYQKVVGHLPPKLTTPSLRPNLPGKRDDAVELAAKNNPNVVAGMFTEQAGVEAIKVIRGQLLPTISIVGDYNQGGYTLAHNQGRLDQINRTVVAQLSMPLYEAGSVYAQTRQAEETVGQLRHQTDLARRIAVEGAAQAWDTMEAARASRDDLIPAVKAAEGAYEGMQHELRIGTRTLTDVIIQEQALFSYRSSQTVAIHDLAVAQYNVAEQIGTLTAVDLKLKTQIYDVDSHYREVRNKWFGF